MRTREASAYSTTSREEGPKITIVWVYVINNYYVKLYALSLCHKLLHAITVLIRYGDQFAFPYFTRWLFLHMYLD